MGNKMKVITKFPNYSITKCGKIYNNKSKKWLSPIKQKTGYYVVFLGAFNPRYIHRLVLEAFVGTCPENMECCHKNGNRQDNNLSNLYLGTRIDNKRDSIKHNTHIHKLNNEDVKLIKYLYNTKLFSLRTLAWQFNVCYNTIFQIIKGITWKRI